MAWLRSNFKLGAAQDFGDALPGSAVVAGSFFPAAAGGAGGASQMQGGFFMGSFASQLSGVGFWRQSALGLLSAFWGTIFHPSGSGYKALPFAIMDISGDGVSSPVFYNLSATHALASVDSIIVIGVRKASQTVGSGVMMTSASNISVHFYYWGWIVSAPSP